MTETGTIDWKYNESVQSKETLASLDRFTWKEANRARTFHQTFDCYEETPLASLPRLAEHWGIGGVYVKDESYRFGLNAFKVLGGAYAIGRYLADRLDMDIGDLSFERLRSPDIRQRLGEITFVTATDGNHGRGVAWAASQLGQRSVVYMPQGSSPTRLEAIRAAGAEAEIMQWNYDECVRHAARMADEHGWVVVQDTAWEGYEAIPEWIMQGYSTLAIEAIEQLRALGVDKPTHVLLQAGVGSFAGAVTALFASVYGSERPAIVIVEPNKADCLYRSARAGKLQIVTGSMDTIMAGLACGEPNPAAWELLQDYGDLYVSCPDTVAAKGMRMLGNPLGDDPVVISGESGAVTAGLLDQLMTDPALAEAKDRIGLHANSHVLLVSTEGDTDPARYRDVVWDGMFPSFARA
ncbi:PLP-dependent lyase/thiolase [Paenibacillus sp. CCS19]|uniref:diaminopropionate ammonia-lyase n=1 Tax=Paenibacillus sp. CCS19 TaxID=3158387 RepID=UPI0025681E5A|nr:diaminopropionate ammonia-lyase [Paenibacillus cellulosilyticus]GMK40840.1 PLP-dependent lyase/thiolase [Paenibacillus cellulosilyticus]